MALDADYRAFVAAQGGAATLWQDAEFLEAAIAGDGVHTWDYLTLERDGRTVAVLPFCRKRRPDGAVVTMPPLVRYGGPLFNAAWLAEVDVAKAYESVLTRWPRGLRSVDQVWGPRHPDAAHLGAAGAGFRESVRTTYTVRVDRPEEQLWAGLHKTMRYTMRRATAHWTLRRAGLDAEVHDILEAPFRRQGLRVPYRRAALQAIFGALQPRGQATSHQALDGDGVVVAASVVLADADSAYCLASGSTEAARARDGGSYVHWEDLRWARASGRARVDFLGSDLPGIADNRRRFGATPLPYPHLYRDDAVWTRALRWWRSR